MVSTWKEDARSLEEEKAALKTGMNDEDRASEYYMVLKQLERTTGEILRVLQRPENCLPYIQVPEVMDAYHEVYSIYIAVQVSW